MYMSRYSGFVYDIEKYGLETKAYDIVAFQYANGCGAKGGFKFPSMMYGVDIKTACNIHDIEWQLAECYADLLDANENFDNNLKKICDQESANNFMRWLRRLRIAKYVNGVEIHGTMAYAIERGFADE